MSGNRKDFRARIVGPPEPCKPAGTTAQNGWCNSDTLHIVDRCRRPIEAHIGREWRLQAWHALLAFQALNQSCFFAANVSTGTMCHVQLEVPAAVSGILAQKPGVISLIDRALQLFAFKNELTTDIDVARVGPHRETGQQTALDQLVRIVAHDLPVFARPRF